MFVVARACADGAVTNPWRSIPVASSMDIGGMMPRVTCSCLPNWNGVPIVRCLLLFDGVVGTHICENLMRQQPGMRENTIESIGMLSM